ncbi:MAG: AAA family ATPase [Tannerellaceae bacterium]
MIAEIKFKNLFSFRDEVIFSFEADKNKQMESYHIVELIPGIRLLKFAVIYGANGSGKSNFFKAYYFLKNFILYTPTNKKEPTGIIPFLMNEQSSKEYSGLSISFYVCHSSNDIPIKYVYSISLNRNHIKSESLIFYPSQQPATLFEREIQNGVSTVQFGNKIKLSAAAKEEVALKCLPNMSVLAAYMQVNLNIIELENVISYFSDRLMNPIASFIPQTTVIKERLKEVKKKEYILKYLQEANFDISDIYTQENTTGDFTPVTLFKHKVQNESGKEFFFDFPERFESEGTLKTMIIAGYIDELISKNAFLAINEIESSLHPKLIEYIIERFVKDSDRAQLIVSTHYDGLLAQDDLLRNDNIWFTEKTNDGATVLYPLTDFKGLNRISSLQKAYRFGKFGAIPHIPCFHKE